MGTLIAVTEQLREIKPEELESEETVETESSDKQELGRGRSRNKGWGKAPVPTPRNKTPSREGTSAKEMETTDTEAQKVVENQPFKAEDENFKQIENCDRDSLEEFVAKENEIIEEAKTSESNANVYIDLDGRWKLELDDNGLEDETDDRVLENEVKNI